MERLQDRA
jgi:hypothetical protein